MPLQNDKSHYYMNLDAQADDLTAQKVEVGIIFQEMLDTATAAAYLAKYKVPIATALRVLTGSRRKKSGGGN